MLRVLVRDAKSSGQHGGYYDNEVGATGKSSRFVTITSRPAPNAGSDVELHKLGDDRSDRSILGNGLLALQGKKGIVQVTDFSVKYDEEGGGRQG